MDFVMEESVNELHEVVITGLSQAAEKNRTPTPITTITPLQLQRIASTNIIDAIASQPGISQLTTGVGVSKPVIRGLGYNRVVVVNDGIRQEGQQWGDEHGIEVDEAGVSKVEILKGPASLSYGSDAMAGVINFISASTLPPGKISGNISAGYQGNNGLMNFSGNLAGNLKGYIWDIRYSNKMAHAYKNKYDGYVFNSGFRENTIGGIAGINKAWGYSHLHFSVYHFNPGIVEGERDSTTGNFITAVAVNDSSSAAAIASSGSMKSYTPGVPFQQVYHYKAVLNNSFVAGDGSLKAIVGWQQNRRQEFTDVLHPDDYGLYFLLNTINYDMRYVLPEKHNLNISIGVNGMHQLSQNKGTEFLVPEYNLLDAGFFAIVKRSYAKLDISGGLRYDIRTETAKDLFLDEDGKPTAQNDAGSQQKFAGFHVNYSGVSGSIGATYQLSEKLFTKLNLSRGFRAPNIAEAGSNGVHEGTIRYEIGDPHLHAESSLQLDFALGLNSEHVNAEVALFGNSIDHFIFLSKLNSAFGGDSVADGYNVFKYHSTDADLTGGEVSVDIHPHPLDWLHMETSFAFVQAVQRSQPDSMKYLPNIPAPKLSFELRADAKKIKGRMKNAYIKAGLEAWFRQDKIYSAYGTETPTAGYLIFNAGAGADIICKGRVCCSLFLNAANLADAAYQSHLSRLKYSDLNNATGRSGVYNMGRNISLKVIVPFDIR
jgi:iron complex outermembrane receptor protein